MLYLYTLCYTVLNSILYCTVLLLNYVYKHYNWIGVMYYELHEGRFAKTLINYSSIDAR